MEQQNLYRRVMFPILLVVGVMLLSINLYDLSRRIDHHSLHLVISHISAVFIFLSVWLGALFGNTIAFFRGASFGERIIVCLAPALLRCALILYDFIGIYSAAEFFFLFLHHIIIGCLLVALLCMGISEIWCRIIARRKTGDRAIKVFALNNTLVLIISFASVFAMLWNGGHFYYYLYMDVYAKLFM
jgi:hypothetical protein